MGASYSNIFHADKCNKCGVPYHYYSSNEHRERLSCYSKKTKQMENHCFSFRLNHIF